MAVASVASRQSLTEKLILAAGWEEVHVDGRGKHRRWHCPCGEHFASSGKTPSREVLYDVKKDLRRCPQTNREVLGG
jgi:hypothetical protein